MARKRSSPPPEIPGDDSDHVDAASDEEEQQSIESDSKNEEQNGGEEEESQEEEDAESANPKEDNDESMAPSSQGSESIGKDPGSGSDSESSPVPVKPIRSKPMKVLSKPDPKPKRKRAVADKSGAQAKRARGVSNANVGDEKRSGIHRLWSEDDEIGILQGLIDYQLAHDEDPYSDLEAFYDFVKDSLHVSVSVKQLSDKIRRLKKKFLVNADKGAAVVFVKPHEDKSFKLSKKIWGAGNGGEDGSKVKASSRKKNIKKKDDQVVINGVNGKVKDHVDDIQNGVQVDDDDDDDGLDFKAMYPYLGKAWDSDFGCSQPLKEISMGNFQSIETEKIRGMDKEWKDMYVKEMQLYVNKLDLKTKHAKVVLDQMINSDV